jgi:hypothetical protein
LALFDLGGLFASDFVLWVLGEKKRKKSIIQVKIIEKSYKLKSISKP